MRTTTLAVLMVVAAAAAAPEPLPAPTLISPADHADIGLPEPARAVTVFLWKAVPGAARYRLMLDLSPTFKKPLHDETLTGTTQSLTGLEVGRYYWRVAAIDGGGAEGPFSVPSRLRVTRVDRSGIPPALDIVSIEARGRVVAVKGKTDAGARVTFNGQPLDVAADGTFDEFVTMLEAGAQEIVLRATARDGGVTEKRQRVVFND